MLENKTSRVIRLAGAASVSLFLVSGCAESSSGDGLEIVGNYDDGFTAHEITDDTWTIGDEVFHIVEFDNEAGFLIANNDDDNEYFPGLWSRFEWTQSDGTLYYCQPVYDGEDEAAALDGAADPDDLEMGCGGFAWSALTPE